MLLLFVIGLNAQGLGQFLATERPSKFMKNAFCFTLKALFVLKIFQFFSWLFSHAEKQLDYKGKINFKIIMSYPGKQAIAIHILPNILRSKGNQVMKFGQLIEYNIRNIFLKKSYTKYGGESIPRPFLKKSKLSISLDK